MELGLFMMPVHRPDKPWAQALEEDRQAVIEADRLGFSEVWIGEHFSTRAEQIPAPMMLFASVLEQAPNVRFGTGVVNLPHHNPIVVAAEAAMLDQISGGRFMLGVGPGGLASDGELFGNEDMAERYRIALEEIDVIIELWRADPPFRIEGTYWKAAIENKVWAHGGVGYLTRPLQKPHPPIALAMVGPGGPTAEYIAERDFIPISANFVPIENVEAQWQAYAAARERAGKPADPAIWRVARNILVTETEAQARDELADPDATFAYYFRYLKGARRLAEGGPIDPEMTPDELNRTLGVAEAIESCAIAGTADQVLERLTALVDRLGPFGYLIMVGHDFDGTELWTSSMRRLKQDVMPKLAQHAASKAKQKPADGARLNARG
jgi:alkanesulfonate monooxygenase SsuD/methylene tetrahydromethanopterin reductase-like flavin-dependent oxidoreductase (luciferase family)